MMAMYDEAGPQPQPSGWRGSAGQLAARQQQQLQQQQQY